MSATAPASTTPPLPPALPKAPQRKPGSPVAGFLIDLGIATLALLGLSLAISTVRALMPWPAIDDNSFSNYYSAFNALRIVIVAPESLTPAPDDDDALVEAERSRSLRIGLLANVSTLLADSAIAGLKVREDRVAEALARQILIRGLGGLFVLDCVSPLTKETSTKLREAFLSAWDGMTARPARVLAPSERAGWKIRLNAARALQDVPEVDRGADAERERRRLLVHRRGHRRGLDEGRGERLPDEGQPRAPRRGRGT